MINMPLRKWVELAFDLQDYAVRCPSWSSERHFDLTAKLPANADTKLIGSMLQTLLAERFGLRYRRETTAVKGLALMHGKKGAKLTSTMYSGQPSSSAGRGKVSARNMTLSGFANLLSGELRYPVVDKTAIRGSFDIASRTTWARSEKRNSRNSTFGG